MFAFRLCLQLGFAHPDILLAQLSSSQFSEWMDYAAVEPFGEFRSELRHGRLMHLLDRAHFTRDKAVTPAHFMAFTDEPKPKELTVEETIKAIDSALGVRT